MNFSTRTAIRAFVRRRSRLRLTRAQWAELVEELGRRGKGTRESGAFLLGDVGSRLPTLRRVVYYDDLDPESLDGGVVLQSSAYGKLWRICADNGMRVIADLHTHPGGFVAQSDSDRTHPTIATVGHVAIVVPHLAAHPMEPTECGLHIYLGGHRWQSCFGRKVARLLYVGRWA